MDGSKPNLTRLVKFFGWLAEPDQEGAGDTPNFAAFEELDKSEELQPFNFGDYPDAGSKSKHIIKLNGLDIEMEVDSDGDEDGDAEFASEVARDIGEISLEDKKKEEEKKADPEGETAGAIDYYNQPGAAMREPYYTSKMGREASLKNSEYHMKMCKSYLDGISWVIRYYHDGVPSWEWFYPYHYAPYLAELNLTVPTWVPPEFSPSRPCRPLEQLLGVLPPQSYNLVPPTYRYLMLSPQSPVISYYPKSFKTDLNGKKAEWEELVLIPFIETEKLRSAMRVAEKQMPLTEEELQRDVIDERVPCYSVSTEAKEMKYDTCIPMFMPGSFVTRPSIRYIVNDYQSPHPISKVNIVKFNPDPFIFPTLFCSNFHSIVKRVQVLIHSRKSNDESIVCVMDPLAPELVKNLELALLGKTVLVGWPYLFPAVVESFCTKEGVVEAAGGGAMRAFGDGGKWFEGELAELSKDFLKRRAVALDNVDVLVEVRPIAGMSHNLDGSCERLYDNGSILVPLQTLVGENPAADWLFSERPASPDLFCPGTRAVAIYNGSLMLVEVAERKDEKDNVRVFPCDRYNRELSDQIGSIAASAAKRSQAPFQGRWIPFHDLAVRCEMAHNYNALLQILDRGEFFPSRKHAGLGIIFQERIGRGPNSTFAPPRIRYGWARYNKGQNIYQSLSFSDAVVDLITEYKTKFHDVFAAFIKAPPGRRPDDKDIGKKGDFILRPVAEWVKTLPHASAPIVPAGSNIMPTDIIRKCVNAAAQLKPAVQSVPDKKNAFSIPVSRLVLPHQVGVYPQTYIPAPAMSECDLLRPLVVGDRVVNLLEDGLIDFGAVGTVISVKGSYCDVAFDRAQYGGTDLDTICPDYHGATRHRIDILPFPVSKRAPRSAPRHA